MNKIIKLMNIRRDSVNTVLAQNANGATLAFFNADESEITLDQWLGLRRERTIEAAQALGLDYVERLPDAPVVPEHTKIKPEQHRPLNSQELPVA